MKKILQITILLILMSGSAICQSGYPRMINDSTVCITLRHVDIINGKKIELDSKSKLLEAAYQQIEISDSISGYKSYLIAEKEKNINIQTSIIRVQETDLNAFKKQNEDLQERIYRDRNKFERGVFVGLLSTILVVAGIVFLP